jgi:hypothetical protein
MFQKLGVQNFGHRVWGDEEGMFTVLTSPCPLLQKRRGGWRVWDEAASERDGKQ